ncbi:hypothetical protein FSP39_021530 [Pinctada imbricata]|uniref:Uncharacterized protein n=1 Tax=Pinctada imbricata TaxID=66713 RepID=A0AA88YKH3_PINIB|nr:hypothetical protein FSP39_021530 [Pinctada imbricata]
MVPETRVWIPDLTLYDNSAASTLPGLKDYVATVKDNGDVKYNFPSVINSMCAIDVRYFPFDYQSCSLEFGSWASPGSGINISALKTSVDMDNYIENIEWSVISTKAIRKEKQYEETYPSIIFTLSLRRKPLFYMMNMIFPCLLITFVAVFGFMLPPDSGEKVNLEVTVLLSLAVFQLIVLDLIPASGDSTPFIGIYFMTSMVLVGMSCLMTVIVLQIHFRGCNGRQISPWIYKRIMIPLAKITFVQLQPDTLLDRQQSLITRKMSIRPNKIYMNGTSSDTFVEHSERHPFLPDMKEIISLVNKITANVDAITQVVCDSDEVITCVELNTSALMDKLFQNYHSDVIPICSQSDTVQTKVGMALRQIIELNEPRQILQINAWIRLRWTDCRLIWNETTYGISQLIVPFSKVWVPDITLYDNANSELEGLKDYRPAIGSDGSMSYNFPSIISSLCKVDVTYFPFDTQICVLKFGSWAYHGLELNVTTLSDTGDLSSFVTNVEWYVTRVPAKRDVITYGCCPEPYPDVTFYVTLERKPLFYILNLLFPCMLISTVACLGFLLPPDSGEKVSLEITVLLSLAVFLLVVSETMPPSSETFPYIGIYFACAMLLVSLSCLMTVTVLNLHFKGSHGKQMPIFIRRIFLEFLGKVVCVKINRERKPQRIHAVGPQNGNAFMYDNKSYESIHETKMNGHDRTRNNTTRHNGVTSRANTLQEISIGDVSESESETSVPVPDVLSLKHSFQSLLEAVNNIEKFMMDKKKQTDYIEEWQLLAQVLDRLFFILFLFVSFVSTISILLKSSLHN